MIIIHHNFDETKFKWLWAKYVKAGNIEKHCTACLIGQYSKKFSGSTNHDLLSQPIIVMDEICEGDYEAIYFCGVLKQGYLNRNPLKNNYRHNVHFVVRPQQGYIDVWDFEGWHVEIENGVVERIPAAYELDERFFHEPYTSHYYTCRIFRWMVGHFFSEELKDICIGYPKVLKSEDGGNEIDTRELVSGLVEAGRNYVEDFFESEDGWGFFENEQQKDSQLKENAIDRVKMSLYISENMGGGCGPLVLEMNSRYAHEKGMPENEMVKYIELGIEEELDMFFPYKERRLLSFQ